MAIRLIVVDSAPPTELITGDGEFYEEGSEDFIYKLHNGVSYRVVAIMGQRSSDGEDKGEVIIFLQSLKDLNLPTHKENVSYDKQMLVEADPSEENEFKSLLYWMRVGKWVVGAGGFLWVSWFLSSFDVSSFAELAAEGGELIEDFPEQEKEKIKKRYKRMKGKCSEIMKKSDEALDLFEEKLRSEWSLFVDELADDLERIVNFPERVEEKVKRRYKKMKGKFRRIMEELEDL